MSTRFQREGDAAVRLIGMAVLAALLLWALVGCTDTVLAPPGLLFGDVDGNGEITIIDADLLYAVTTGSSVIPLALIQACGDVDGDKLITVLDAYYIRAYLQGTTRGRVGQPCTA